MAPTSGRDLPDQVDATAAAADPPAPQTGRRLELERTTPGRSDAAVCTANLYPDLFGVWHLERCWYRFGRGMTARRTSYTDAATARRALDAWCREKMLQGYRLRVDRQRTLGRMALDSLPFAGTAGHDIRRIMDLCNETIRGLHCQRTTDHAAWADDLTLLRMVLHWYDQPLEPSAVRGDLSPDMDPDDAERVLMRQVAALLLKLAEQLIAPSFFRTLMQDAAVRLRRDAEPDVRGFIPPRLHAYLNHSILGFLGEDRAFAAMALRMARDGIDYIGDLVKLPTPRILDYLNGHRHHLLRLREELAAYGLSLNCHTPGWQRPKEAVRTSRVFQDPSL